MSPLFIVGTAFQECIGLPVKLYQKDKIVVILAI